MSFKSILVNLDIDAPAGSVIKAARGLASHFRARLIGFCAADAAIPVTIPDGGAIGAEVWQQMRDDIESRFKELHADFDSLTAGIGAAEWQESLDFPTRALAEMSKAADLIVMTAPLGASSGDTYRAADPGSVVLQAGRPVLALARGAHHVPLKKAVVAWKDTREARRAVADAVPLLSSAEEVSIVTVAAVIEPSVRQGVADVIAFLSHHGIKARPELIESSDEGMKLAEFIAACEADFVVSGAYGHSRFREWAFGGVTRSLLDETGLNRFMSS
jgi:nucleotide-binding universal stress UspA family protein